MKKQTSSTFTTEIRQNEPFLGRGSYTIYVLLPLLRAAEQHRKLFLRSHQTQIKSSPLDLWFWKKEQDDVENVMNWYKVSPPAGCRAALRWSNGNVERSV